MSVEQLNELADIPQLLEAEKITRLMHLIWSSRRDLQLAFDLKSPEGQKGYFNWYQVSVNREYGLNPNAEWSIPHGSSSPARRSRDIHSRLLGLEGVLSRAARRLPRPLRSVGRWLWLRLLAIGARVTSAQQLRVTSGEASAVASLEISGVTGLPGANLIGYAHAELGMGEHVRMSAAAMQAAHVPFGVINFDVGVSSRKEATLDHGAVEDENKYKANIFHINADQMLRAYCHLGHGFFRARYNIGYWAWELSRCPDEWLPAIDMVDEIWAPSRFIQDAFRERVNIPVEYMPLCVSLPDFRKRDRRYFGLPDGVFLFIFSFDFLSFIDRKNPFAIIQAFRRAFSRLSDEVGLVIKVMNGDPSGAGWRDMMDMIGGDPRVHVINKTLDRSDVLSLVDVCDSYVSLHRSEGFGRGPAEAMYLGKPVIVTGYSGNMDFTLPDNSCLVDYALIPVKQGQYVFENNQVWAEPSVEHAADYMVRLYSSSSFARGIGEKGRSFIRSNFGEVSVGRIYRDRLSNIGLI